MTDGVCGKFRLTEKGGGCRARDPFDSVATSISSVAATGPALSLSDSPVMTHSSSEQHCPEVLLLLYHYFCPCFVGEKQAEEVK